MDYQPGRQNSGSHLIRTTKRILKYKDYLRELYVNIKHTNICVIGFSEKEGGERENLFEE